MIKENIYKCVNNTNNNYRNTNNFNTNNFNTNNFNNKITIN